MDDQAGEHSSLKMTQARVRKALQQGASRGFRESRRAPRASPQQQAQHLPVPPKVSRRMAQAWPRPQDERAVFSLQSPLLASRLRPLLPSPPNPRNVFAQAPRVRGRASSSASFFQ